jgi:prepilin-type N-terminal cleavage/methylation domain-containing protein
MRFEIAAKPDRSDDRGFTLIEVIVAASIMIILCIGMLSVFGYVIKINRGENYRMQSLSVLQQEVEYYRSLKFVPNGSPDELNGGTYPGVRSRTSANGRVFSISVEIDNDPYTAGVQTGGDATCTFKEIKITAAPTVPEPANSWTSIPQTVSIQRVRYN